jgi:hypothetical protein
MHTKTITQLREVTQGEIGIESQTFIAGYNIINSTSISGGLDIYPNTTYAGNEKNIIIEIDTVTDGLYYPYGDYNNDAIIYPTYK